MQLTAGAIGRSAVNPTAPLRLGLSTGLRAPRMPVCECGCCVATGVNDPETVVAAEHQQAKVTSSAHNTAPPRRPRATVCGGQRLDDMFALRRLNSAMAAQPLVTSLVVTSAKAAVADVMVQTVIEGRKKDVDQRRVFLFGAFGFAYQGAFQYWLINHVWERAFPGRAWRAVAAKVFCMNVIGASARRPARSPQYSR